MGDIKSKRIIIVKGWLFLFVGLFSAILLVVRNPEIETFALLGIAVWAFCRFYYFAFYVIEHYVDGRYRFAGLVDFIRYNLRDRKSDNAV